MSWIGRQLATLVTEDDANKVVSLVHVGGVGLLVTFVGGAIQQMVHGIMDLQSFGIGGGSLIAAIAGAIYGNAKAPPVVEPKVPTPQPPPGAKPPGQTP